MGFFDEINSSVFVNTLKRLTNGRDHEIYFTDVRKLTYCTNMCFTVSGSLRDSLAGGSSPVISLESVNKYRIIAGHCCYL